MRDEKRDQGRPEQSCVVGVIASPAALVRAAALRRPPDFFELRLDALRHSLGEISPALPRLRAPLILTARHPAEGGRGRLSFADRSALLRRFLPQAAYVDLEMRSVRAMGSLREEMRAAGVKLIISRHYLRQTPSLGTLSRCAASAAAFHPAIVKIVTRTDTAAQLDRLLAFFEAKRFHLPLAAMGTGRLGRESRRRLGQLGSLLTYASVEGKVVAGQPALAELQRARDAYII